MPARFLARALPRPSLLLALAVATAPAIAPAHEPELVLAGGSLSICSSLAPNACTDVDAVSGAQARMPSRYRLDAASRDAALDPALWHDAPSWLRPALGALLTAAAARHGEAELDADTLDGTLASLCLDEAGDGAALRAGDCATVRGPRPWRRLLDEEQAAVYAALELPQRDAEGTRRTERVSLAASRERGGVQVIERFVAAARARSEGVPRIAVVTASGFDSFDAVDYYLALMRAAGADAEWWPIDAALAAAAFGGDCAQLPVLRRRLLRLPGRERVYPDLDAQQRTACTDAAALAALPRRVQGIFFAGGDQWRLRRAFVDAADAPNPALRALRAAFADGALVVGGTSAGMAVQSGGPMLGNGEPAAALSRGTVAAAPPAPGCARAGRCARELPEDSVTYWRAGGLGLIPELVFDTHFSERARESRLVRLLVDTGTRFGLGADEASAFRLVVRGERRYGVEALGARGGWVFDAGTGSCAARRVAVTAHYLAPGVVATLDADGLAVDAALATSVAPPAGGEAEASGSDDALADGALRAAAARLGEGRERIALRAGDARIALTRSDATRAWRTDRAVGVTGLAFAIELPAASARRCAE